MTKLSMLDCWYSAKGHYHMAITMTVNSNINASQSAVTNDKKCWKILVWQHWQEFGGYY